MESQIRHTPGIWPRIEVDAESGYVYGQVLTLGTSRLLYVHAIETDRDSRRQGIARCLLTKFVEAGEAYHPTHLAAAAVTVEGSQFFSNVLNLPGDPLAGSGSDILGNFQIAIDEARASLLHS